MTVSKRHLKIALAISLLLPASILSGPGALAEPPTKEQLEQAEATVARLEGEAQAATREYERLYAEVVQTEAEIAAIRDDMEEASQRIEGLAQQLARRARAAYQLGGSSTLELLLEARSLSEFSDRVVYLDVLAKRDASLVARVDVLAEQLRRDRQDLALLLDRLTKAQAEAKQKADLVYAKLEDARALREKLEDRLAAEQAAAAAAAKAATTPAIGGSGSIPTVAGGALDACPAPGTSFVDSWGAPRSGGRSHAGVDMMGPYGTPVYAAQSGTVSHSSSSLGGIQAYVYGDNGDVMFYAHLQGYSDASGHVSAGTLIGYIGDSGNATGTPHLHFEYHPGGGGPVNPYPYVVQVC